MPPTTLAAATRTEGKRFAFGENWLRFLAVLDEDRIQQAVMSLSSMLRVADLNGKTFLDVGCGSGLFSLAARRLGAEVTSFDRDEQSRACTEEVKRRFGSADDPHWKVESGDVMDSGFVQSLGTWDVVYAWGVLHHTGAMWEALDQAAVLVKPGGSLFISIYNDQGVWSRWWLALKKLYVSSTVGRWLATTIGTSYFLWADAKSSLLRGRLPLASVRAYRQRRGMSIWHDWIDWFGGYPFEVAQPSAIVDFYVERGFVLTGLRTVGSSLGTNQFVLRRDQATR
jgi:2-polyprenyl-3-methyl-5-hydroxy-6-metoxy-1,4-benzoquinol methylase